MKNELIFWLVCACLIGSCTSSNKITQTENDSINYPSYKGLVMCGYQGWFRAEGDGTGRGWEHYGAKRKFDPQHITVDFWPDISEYSKTYPTAFVDKEGKAARTFSSVDESTVNVHFKWMKDYGIDGVFMQRFYSAVRNPARRKAATTVLKHAVTASQKYDRAIAVMYDLSGIKGEEDLDLLKEDWKRLVSELKLSSPKVRENYLHHNGKPLVAIWGLGFKSRPYNIQQIKLDEFLDLLQNDPEYGGFSIMVGVPTGFRTLSRDCVADPYLHEVIRRVDIVHPWMVGRFRMKDFESNSYQPQLAQDLAWCEAQGVDYVPTLYPGFSWYNLSRREGKLNPAPLNHIPRLKGKFLQTQIDTALSVGCKMLYIAMFDEIDEGTAIFKCTNEPPVNATFSDYEGLPSDHYLRLVGEAAKRLKQPLN